jgi:type IV secretion system protein VirB10
MVAYDRAEKQREPPTLVQASTGGDTRKLAKGIVERQAGKTVVPPAVPAPPASVPASALLPASGPVLQIARPDLDMPPRPPGGGGNQMRDPAQEEQNRIRAAKQGELQEAVRAKTAVPFAQLRSGGSPSGGSAALPSGTPQTRDEMLSRIAAVRQEIDSATRRENPTDAYKARLAQLQTSGLAPSPSGAGMPGGAGGAGEPPRLLQPGATQKRNDIGQLAGNGQADRWRLDSGPDAPRTPFELRAGFVIPGILISGINSELPGHIMGQVSQDVYDTPTGKYKLIPQGSRLHGQYLNEVIYGQSRILVAWQRIIFPDGKAMDIGAMPGADSAGYAGFSDQVDNHYIRIFASAILMSAVTAAVSYSQSQNQNYSAFGNSQPSASSEMSAALGQQLGTVASQMIAKNLNIAPTLEIRPGYRFNIIVIKDMTFSKPYAAFDY